MRYLGLSRLGEDECVGHLRASLLRKMQSQPSWSLLFSEEDIRLVSSQHLSNYKSNTNQLYYKRIEICLEIEVIREGFPEEVAFNC